MEVDGASWHTETPRGPGSEGGKFTHMKAFIAAAREFQATHSDTSISLMSRNLGLIVSTWDLTIFAPGRSEVCLFFSSLWHVMSDERGPQWAGVAALARAARDSSARHALTHNYKFMPILARLLTNSISLDNKMRLLSLMQDLSYGIKISWQELYLPSLIKQLTDWVSCDTSLTSLGHAALTVLVNLCYGNLPAIYTLQRTIDTKEFVTRLINMKDGGYEGVEVCRLLLCLSAGMHSTGSSARNVHSYLSCAADTLIRAIVERNPTALHHTYMFLGDLCKDSSLKSQVITYPHFSEPMDDAIKSSLELCSGLGLDNARADADSECLEQVLNCLTLLTELELFSLRELHSGLLELSLKGSRICLGPSLQLFSAIVSQYKEDGRLPQHLGPLISDVLPTLLVPPALEPGRDGLPWLNAVGALCEFTDLQERLLHHVTPAVFEDTLFTVLQLLQQSGCVGAESAQQACVVGCRAAIALAPHHREWDAALARLLAHPQMCKLLSASLCNGGAQQRQVLQLVKHPHFPPDKINQVVSCNDALTGTAEAEPGAGAAEGSETLVREAWGGGAAEVSAMREQALDSLIERLNQALDKQQMVEVTTSSVMELYGYKMSCLEQRLHFQAIALQAASDQTASLQHSLALMQSTSSTQQDILYNVNTQNEKHKQNVSRLNAQLADAEKSLRGFRLKLAAERLNTDNRIESLNNAQRAQRTMLEAEVQIRDKSLAEKEAAIEKLQKDIEGVNSKLQQQATKNNELGGVLVKFEERVMARDRKLEEASVIETALRKELEHKEQMVKQLEKTILERDTRLYQLTGQLEEMKRVQDMVAKLMNSGKNAGS